MFVVLLGYFKVKPITLSLGYHQIKHDIKYVCSEVFPGSGLALSISLEKPGYEFTTAFMS